MSESNTTPPSAAGFDPTQRVLPPPDQPYRDQLASVRFTPVFIMGEHRSGTTILYKMLGLSECFNVVTAYHVFCCDRILADQHDGTRDAAKRGIDEYLAANKLQNRLVDDMPVNADFSAEYGALLLRKHRRLGLSPKTWATFDEFCRKVQCAGAPGRPLLLKNPPDSDRFLYIHRAYPHARFVFIHRHPLDVISSKLRAVERNWREGNPWVDLMFPLRARLTKSKLLKKIIQWLVFPRPGTRPGIWVLAWHSRRVRRNFARRISWLPSECYIRLRYEDLCREPQKHITKILEFAGCPSDTTINYATLIARRPRQWPRDIEGASKRLCRFFGCGPEEDAYEV